MDMSSNKKKYSGSKSYGKTSKKKEYTNIGILEATLKSLIKKGRDKITTREELLKYPKGSQISFVTNKNIYRAGGYLKFVGDTYFKYYPTIQKKGSLPVRFKDIKKIYIGSPLYFTGKRTKSNFPVKLGEKIIYYAKDNFDKDRFMGTTKYKTMKEWYNTYNK